MTKIVYNACYGGFSLSDEAIELYLDTKGFTYEKKRQFGYTDYAVHGWDHFNDRDLDRADPILIEVVEKLGDEANGMCAKLCIEDLPKGTLYRITEYDGYESIETNEDLDWNVA